MPYPDVLAAGLTNLGRFDWSDVIGPGPFKDDRAQAADGQAITQFQVLAYNSDGRLVPWASTGDYAFGTVTFTDSPTDTETISVNGNAITFIASGTPAADEVLISATDTVTVSRFVDVINSDPTLYAVHATVDATGLIVTVTALEAGTGGNTIALAEATATAATVSGATLTDVTGAETVPSGNAVAVAMETIAAATPGGMVPIRIMGTFNHDKLVWPAGVAALEQRRLAFAGTPLNVIAFL